MNLKFRGLELIMVNIEALHFSLIFKFFFFFFKPVLKKNKKKKKKEEVRNHPKSK